VSKKTQILALHEENPIWDCRDIASEVGASPAYVLLVARRCGVKLPHVFTQRKRPGRPRAAPAHFPYLDHRTAAETQ